MEVSLLLVTLLLGTLFVVLPLVMNGVLATSLKRLVFGFADLSQVKSLAAESAEDKFRIRIPRVRYDTTGNFVQYQLLISYGGRKWDTWRRYSEFRAFAKRHSLMDSMRFPPKSSSYQILSGSEHTVEFTDKRRKALENFMYRVVKNEDIFGQLCLFMKEGQERVGASGYFFSVPVDISFDDVKLKPSRVELVTEGLKAFEVLVEQLALVQAIPVKAPWKQFSEDKKKHVVCYCWENGDRLDIAITAKVPCSKTDLFDLILDSELRPEWDEDQELRQGLEAFVISDRLPSNSELSSDLHFLLQDEASLDSDDKKQISSLCLDFEEKFRYKICFSTVEYSRMKSPAPMVVAKRDFITLALCARHIDTGDLVTCITSVDYILPSTLAKDVQSAKCVRAKHIVSGTVLGGSADSTDFVTVSMVDPGAYVPPSIIKMFAPKKAAELPLLAELAKERNAKKKGGASKFFLKE